MNTRETPEAVFSALAQSGSRQEGFRSESLRFREVDNRSLVRLRALPGVPAGYGAMGDLPPETGQCTGVEPVTLCLRPGEWLVVSADLTAEALCRQIAGDDDEAKFFTWDESDALAVIRIEGTAAAWLLRKHCGLELPFNTQTPRCCAQTKFAHISVLIHCCVNRPEQAYDIYVERSLARYLWELLADAAPHAIELHQGSGTAGTD